MTPNDAISYTAARVNEDTVLGKWSFVFRWVSSGGRSWRNKVDPALGEFFSSSSFFHSI